MTRTLYVVLAALLLAVAPATATQHSTAQAGGQAQAQASAGVTPDSALYGLETAWENVRTAFTFNSAAKAQMKLEQADERVAEMQAMIDANNSQAAAKAAKGYQARVNAAANAAARINNDGSEEQAREGLRQSSQARAQLQANLAHVAQVHAQILERQEARMNQEQYAHLESVFANVTQAGLSADAQIENKREESKQRYQAIANVNAQQANDVAAQISSETGLQAQISAHQNALNGLSVALQASSNRSERAQTVLEQRINALNASTSVGADVAASANAAIGANAQAESESSNDQQQTGRQRQEQNGSADAQASARAGAQAGDSQVNGSAQGGIDIEY